ARKALTADAVLGEHEVVDRRDELVADGDDGHAVPHGSGAARVAALLGRAGDGAVLLGVARGDVEARQVELDGLAVPAGEVHDGQARIEVAELEVRSEEHTSELQSRFEIVCRLLVEKTNDGS